MALLLLFSFFAFASPILGAWQDGDDGVDRPYGDLPGMPITMGNSDIASDCAQMCATKGAQCKGWAYLKPFCDGQVQPLCFLKAELNQQKYNQCAVSGLPAPAKMLWDIYRPLPLGTITPQGWLRDQLDLQASGLSGHLPLFWEDVMNSSWIGGKADTGLHERTPYWLNGIVPLAYQLNNPTLIALVNKYVDYILSNQQDDGWLGPDDEGDGNMYWSKFPMLLALTQYCEANSSDARVLPAMLKALKAIHSRMFITPLSETWSGARWQDLVLTVHWMLRNHPQNEEQMLWDLAELLTQQGFDWKGWFGGDSFPTQPATKISLYTHGVNIGQAIKSGAVWFRQSHNMSDYSSSFDRVKRIDKYHGLASGIFGCDEHLAGNMPSRGSELCTVVETMYSFEMMFSILGEHSFAERVELLAFNALPATITPDMWAHQYLQQSNEMNAVHSDDHVWTHDGPDSTLYGLAPNYGCCTANFNQGWPKFAQYVVMELEAGQGLVVATYSPVSIQHTLSSGQKVTLDMITDYPFNDIATIKVDCGSSMQLSLLIPSWTVGPTLSVNQSFPQSLTPGTVHSLTCSWLTSVIVTIPQTLRMTRRYNDAAAIYRGPLLYGLQIDEQFKTLKSYAFNSKDYQVTPGSPWNYALQLNEETINSDLEVVVSGLKKGIPPFSKEGAPVRIKAKGRLLTSWQLEHNSAAPPPISPVMSNQTLTPLTLLPFGATNLRIAEIPVLNTH